MTRIDGGRRNKKREEDSESHGYCVRVHRDGLVTLVCCESVSLAILHVVLIYEVLRRLDRSYFWLKQLGDGRCVNVRGRGI